MNYNEDYCFEDIIDFFHDVKKDLKDQAMTLEAFNLLYAFYLDNDVLRRFNMYFTEFLDELYDESYDLSLYIKRVDPCPSPEEK
jgi:hypothetical protein